MKIYPGLFFEEKSGEDSGAGNENKDGDKPTSLESMKPEEITEALKKAGVNTLEGLAMIGKRADDSKRYIDEIKLETERIERKSADRIEALMEEVATIKKNQTTSQHSQEIQEKRDKLLSAREALRREARDDNPDTLRVIDINSGVGKIDRDLERLDDLAAQESSNANKDSIEREGVKRAGSLMLEAVEAELDRKITNTEVVELQNTMKKQGLNNYISAYHFLKNQKRDAEFVELQAFKEKHSSDPPIVSEDIDPNDLDKADGEKTPVRKFGVKEDTPQKKTRKPKTTRQRLENLLASPNLLSKYKIVK